MVIEPLGAQVLVVSSIDVPKDIRLYGNWGLAFTKLALWNLTQYDKIVYMDSDLLVMRNCDELFLQVSGSLYQFPSKYLTRMTFMPLKRGLRIGTSVGTCTSIQG